MVRVPDFSQEIIPIFHCAAKRTRCNQNSPLYRKDLPDIRPVPMPGCRIKCVVQRLRTIKTAVSGVPSVSTTRKPTLKTTRGLSHGCSLVLALSILACCVHAD